MNQLSETESHRRNSEIVFTTRWMFLILLPALLSLVFVACGGSSDSETALQRGPTPVSAPLSVAMVTTDLAVGENRVAFGILQMGQGVVKDAQVEVQTYHITEAEIDGPKQTVPAPFDEWDEVGAGGIYVTQLNFDTAGSWGLGIIVTLEDGTEAPASARVQVLEESRTPAIGAPAVPSNNRTARDVSALNQLSSDPEPDPDLMKAD